MNRRGLTMLTFAIAVVAGIWGARYASAQAPAGFKRVELLRHDVAMQGREAVLARAEFQVGGAAPRHTHPGDEVAYILEGEVTIDVEGKGPQALKAGDTIFIPAGQVHSAKNTGKGAAAVLSTYIVEKGKPIATPVK